MGGNIAWTIRLSDGTEYRMCRWTNIMPSMGRDMDFFAEKPEAVSFWLEQWLGMKADWEKNKTTGEYEHNMTSVYAPYPYGLMPSEYGIVVTDFVNKKLISCQGYNTFANVMVHPNIRMMDEDKPKEVEKLFELGLVIGPYEPRTGVTTEMPGASLEEMIKAGADKDRFTYLALRPPPGWERLELFVDKMENRQATYEAIVGCGFDLNKKEQAAFNSWIKRG